MKKALIIPLLLGTLYAFQEAQLATLKDFPQLNIYFQNNLDKLKKMNNPLYIKKTSSGLVVFSIGNFNKKKLKNSFKNFILYSNVTPPKFKNQRLVILYTDTSLLKIPIQQIKNIFDKLKNIKPSFKEKYLKCYKSLKTKGNFVILPIKCLNFTYPLINGENISKVVKINPANPKYIKMFYLNSPQTSQTQKENTKTRHNLKTFPKIKKYIPLNASLIGIKKENLLNALPSVKQNTDKNENDKKKKTAQKPVKPNPQKIKITYVPPKTTKPKNQQTKPDKFLKINNPYLPFFAGIIIFLILFYWHFLFVRKIKKEKDPYPKATKEIGLKRLEQIQKLEKEKEKKEEQQNKEQKKLSKKEKLKKIFLS